MAHPRTSLPRVDGRLKVTGRATYPIDVSLAGQAHAALVQSTIARGRIVAIATTEAERAPGVVAVLTHLTAPAFPPGPMTPLGPSPLPPLQGPEIAHYGQHVAVVVAETLEQAQAAAPLVTVTYERDTAVLDEAAAESQAHPWLPDLAWGDVTRAMSNAEVHVDATYSTAENAHSPIGLFAVVAEWQGERLVVHDTTQWPHGVKETLAGAFGLATDDVRVLTPYVGGAFGAGLRVWPHVTLTAWAARVTRRPVKLVLTRAQMFTSLGHRPPSVNRVRLGLTRDGVLTAIDHEARSPMSMAGDFYNPVAAGSAEAYACPNLAVRERQARVDIRMPSWMRAPGHAEGLFALESAIDEAAHRVGCNPLEFRRRNHAPAHPHTGLPWSSNALLECYTQGAERFGWPVRMPAVRAMASGDVRVGYGMARAALSAYQAPCTAEVTLHRDGSASVRSGATDIGAGTYTVITQLAAELLGLPTDRVRVRLGDSAMPKAPQQGGSGLTAALGNAVHAACLEVVRGVVECARVDERSPLRGCRREDVRVGDEGLHLEADPGTHDSYAALLGRHGADVTREGASVPPASDAAARAGAFAAHFVEVRVDEALGTVRVTRVVTAVDGGRILNETVARSQIIGGVVGGIGMALFEEVVSRDGRPLNTSLGEYVVPVSADVPDVDVIFVGGPDPLTPVGTKGIGELAIIGVAAAIANAVYHATGRRCRDLPLTLDRLMA